MTTLTVLARGWALSWVSAPVFHPGCFPIGQVDAGLDLPSKGAVRTSGASCLRGIATEAKPHTNVLPCFLHWLVGSVAAVACPITSVLLLSFLSLLARVGVVTCFPAPRRMI